MIGLADSGDTKTFHATLAPLCKSLKLEESVRVKCKTESKVNQLRSTLIHIMLSHAQEQALKPQIKFAFFCPPSSGGVQNH